MELTVSPGAGPDELLDITGLTRVLPSSILTALGPSPRTTRVGRPHRRLPEPRDAVRIVMGGSDDARRLAPGAHARPRDAPLPPGPGARPRRVWALRLRGGGAPPCASTRLELPKEVVAAVVRRARPPGVLAWACRVAFAFQEARRDPGACRSGRLSAGITSLTLATRL